METVRQFTKRIGWRLRPQRDPFAEMLEGIAKTVRGVREQQPEWQRIEIRRTADGITFAIVPDLPKST
jgi:hypothetical protein